MLRTNTRRGSASNDRREDAGPTGSRQRNFPKNIDFIPAQDRQEKSEQSSADPPESSEVFSRRVWRVLVAPAWVLADERPSFPVDAANSRAVTE